MHQIFTQLLDISKMQQHKVVCSEISNISAKSRIWSDTSMCPFNGLTQVSEYPTK